MDVTRLRVTKTSPWVLLRLEKTDAVTAGGLLLPEAQTEKHEDANYRAGTVVACGERYRPRKPGQTVEKRCDHYVGLDVTPGQRVAFRGFLKQANLIEGDDGYSYCFVHVDDLTMEIGPEVKVGALV